MGTVDAAKEGYAKLQETWAGVQDAGRDLKELSDKAKAEYRVQKERLKELAEQAGPAMDKAKSMYQKLKEHGGSAYKQFKELTKTKEGETPWWKKLTGGSK